MCMKMDNFRFEEVVPKEQFASPDIIETLNRVEIHERFRAMPTPSPSELSLVTLLRCLPLLLLFFLTTPTATTLPPDVHLPPLEIAKTATVTHRIPRTASLHQQITLPQNCTALVETFYDTPPPFPHPLLLVSPHREPPLILSPREAPPGVHADYEAFWTRRSYAYLFITNRTRLYIRVYDHHDTFADYLNATLRITIVPAASCPRGPAGDPCSGRGSCRAGECVCDNGFAGRYCEAAVKRISQDPFTVPFEQMVHYKYPVPINGSVAVRMLVQREEHTGSPVVFAKRAYENGGYELLAGPPLPSVYDVRFDGRAGILPVQTVVRDGLKRGDILYIGVCNLPRVFLDRRYHGFTGLLAAAPVTVQLEAFPCANRKVDGIRRCPAAAHESWELSLTFLLLPLLLGTLTLLTMVVCVSVWAGVFRQQIFEVIHGHAQDENLPRRDKLSEAEVNAMFPAFTFTKGETAALGATGDVCCSVCLSSFEEGELLRRLACGHSYHSICLDRWLLTNATCPRCRKAARIHGEIGRWWLLRRHMSRVIARANGFLHWLVGFSQPRVRESPELESVEVEGLIPNRDDGISRRYVQTS